MINVCSENNFKISSCARLPERSYSYVSERWNTTSWLDYASNDFHSSISKINIMYDVSDEYHILFKVYINSSNISNFTSSINNGRAKIRWNNMTGNDISKYCMLIERCLHDIHNIPAEAVGCRDTQCTNVNHIESLNKIYNETVNTLIKAGEESLQNKKRSYTNKRGWAEYVDSLYDTSREVRHMWVNAGKPRHRSVYDLHVKSKARFKYALRFIKNNENTLGKEALAKKLAEINPEALLA